jgi:hypothetical protein
LICEARAVLGHCWPEEPASWSAGRSGVDEWAGVETAAGDASLSHGDLPKGETGEDAEGPVVFSDFTVKLFAGVEFWMERLPTLLGSALKLRQAGARRLFPFLI